MKTMRHPQALAAATALLFLSAPFAQAVVLNGLTLGKDITVNDGNNSSSSAVHGGPGNADTRLALPYGATSGTKILVREDNEVEAPNAQWGQSWDLEAIFFNPGITNRLSIVGGYDFLLGNGSGSMTGSGWYRSGDMLIDVAPFNSNLNTFGASTNYVIKFHWDDNLTSWGSASAVDINFSIYKKGVSGWAGTFSNSTFFPSSDPWRYNPGTNETVLDTGVATVFRWNGTLTTDEGYTLQGGGTRYALFIGGASDTSAPRGIGAILQDAGATDAFGANFTMRCGNDEITGWHPSALQVPDSGMTLVLLGAALLGMGCLRRKA